MKKNDKSDVLEKGHGRKLNLKMKFCFLMASFMLIQLSANSVMSENKIQFSYDNVPLKRIFKEISSQTGYKFFYNVKEINDKQITSLTVNEETIKEVLHKLSFKANFDFNINKNQIVLTHQRIISHKSQDSEIKGTITDGDGVALPGANILEKGTTNGTQTDFDGNFSITVGENAVLVISYIGFETMEVPVDGQSNISVSMLEDAAGLEEVVIIGYGTQRKSDLTGSVGVVSMDNIREMPVAGVDQALSGQIAGLQISTSNGIPGGGPNVQLRGIGAIGAASQPLYVVDGFALSSTSSQISNPLNTIPPQDVESVTILKDASATAIYGSRGANGVIIITTKKGTSGKSKVQVSVNTGYQILPSRSDPDLMNAEEFARFKQQSYSDQILADTGQEATADQIPEVYRNPEQYGEGTNWFDVITHAAPVYDINFSLSGGNENLRTYMSAGYLNQDGVVVSTGYERYSLRFNIDGKLSEKLKVGANLAPTFSKRGGNTSGGGGRGGGGFGDAVVASPIPPVYNEDGTYNAMIQEHSSIFPYPNPLMSLKESKDESESMRILGSVFAVYEIIDNLNLKSSFNVDWQDARRDYFRPSTLGRLFQFPPTIPVSFYERDSYLNWSSENNLTYANIFGDHSIDALAGFSIQKEKSRSADFQGNDYPDDDVQTFNAAARITGGTSIEEWSLISYLARVNYNFKNRYLLTATIRRDGSSRFGTENRWGNFPSIALGWNVSKESFMRNADKWLNDFKVRASYGQSGNFQIGNYTYRSNIASNNYILGGQLVGGKTMTSLANPNLGWEKMNEINLGVDIGLWNNRLTLSADFYKRNTESLLLQTELPGSSGFTSAIENFGKMENKGFELSISSNNFARENFSWSTDFNFSLNRNEIIQLGPTNTPILAGSSYEGNPTNITMVGEPLGMFYGFVADGIYQTQAEIDSQPSFPGAVPGNLRMKDIDGNGIIEDEKDFTIIGNPYPDFSFGITNTITYKNFDLKVIATSQIGGEKIRTNQFSTHLSDGLFNANRDLLDRWRSPSQPGNGIVPTTNGSGYGRRLYRDISSIFIEDYSYFWIKNITLGYNLPQGMVKGIANARFYGSVQNGLLFTDFSGNPETQGYGSEGNSSLTPGYDSNPYPVPVIYSIGINLTF